MPDRPLAELEEMIGTSKVTAQDLRVEAGKVEEFARAVRDDSPIHRDEAAAREAGFDAIPAPVTFLLTAAFPRYRPEGTGRESRGFDIGFDSRYNVHGEQEFEFERPVQVGDVLTGTTTLTDVYQREGERGGTMTFATFETVYRDQSGEKVVTERTTAIELGKVPDDETKEGSE